MNQILGISLELQEKILKLIKSLVKENRKLSGTIIMVEDIGPGFCWGITNQASLRKAIEYFCESEYKLSIVKTVKNMPAANLMQEIHRLRDEANLPGILKYLSKQKAA